MSSCSVIIVSHHTGPGLIAAAKSVLKQKPLAELIVVDHGNTPAMLARLQQMALGEPRLKMLFGRSNETFAAGCNAGATLATGEFLLFLSDDALLPPDALAQAIKSLDEIPQAVVAGAWMQHPDRSEIRGARAMLPTPAGVLAKPAALPDEVPLDAHAVPAIGRGFMCIRKKHFEMLGGFDVAFAYGEDRDLCMRVERGGGKVICAPKIKVTRMLPGGRPRLPRQRAWQKTKGEMRYFHKHFADKPLPLLWLVDAVLIANFAANRLCTFAGNITVGSGRFSHSVAAKRLMILASGLAELPEKKDLYGKAVLVTGATSQIGLCVIKRLIASGAAVLAVSRVEAIPFRHENLRWIQGDLADETFHLHGYLVDMVVHCAPIWHLPATIDMLAEAEVRRVIAFGSTSIFAKALSKNSFEHDMVEKLTHAETELARRCDEHRIGWTILRPTVIYGVGLDESVTTLAKLIDCIGIAPIYPPASGKRQPVHADDLAIAALQAAASPASEGKSYNVSGADVLTYREMLERIFATCRKKPRIIETTALPFLLDMAGKLLRKSYLNGEIARRMNDDLVFFHDDATRDFGFSPRGFLSGGMKDIEGF